MVLLTNTERDSQLKMDATHGKTYNKGNMVLEPISECVC